MQKSGIVAFALVAGVATPAVAQLDPQILETAVKGAKNDVIGTVVIRGGAKATVLRITLQPGALTPGWHGVHLHAVGDCSDAGQFQRSKGHVNHAAHKHGLLRADGPDNGDLPNVFAQPDGSVQAELSSHMALLAGADGLRDGDGTALIFHANEDDHNTQPIGNAGGRVACALIK
jgi:superoxide dismutase, Cu-Zn family